MGCDGLVASLSGSGYVWDDGASDLCDPVHGGENREEEEGVVPLALWGSALGLAQRNVFSGGVFGDHLGVDTVEVWAGDHILCIGRFGRRIIVPTVTAPPTAFF